MCGETNRHGVCSQRPIASPTGLGAVGSSTTDLVEGVVVVVVKRASSSVAPTCLWTCLTRLNTDELHNNKNNNENMDFFLHAFNGRIGQSLSRSNIGLFGRF